MSDANLDWPRFEHVAPAVVSTLRSLSRVIAESGLEPSLTELLKIRASQLNGCAFCLGLHLTFARKAGVPQRTLDLVATWREAGIFSARERAALEWTEALTLMAHQPVPDELYHRVCEQFPTQDLAFLTSSIGLINAWNRIAGGLRFAPG